MAYFPLFTDLQDKKVLVVGGGRAAQMKIYKLREYGADITCVSREFEPELLVMPDIHRISLEVDESFVKEEDLDKYYIVVSASGDPKLDLWLHQLCRKHKILFNAVDNRDLSDFIFPASILEGELSIGISTSGASPSASRYLKNEIAAKIPSYFPELLNSLEETRGLVLNRVEDEKTRAKIFHVLFETGMKLKKPLTESEVEKIIDQELAR